jgi:hypothetical protein
MKSPLRVAIQVTALFVLFVGAVFVGRSLPVPGQAEAALIKPAPPARPLSAPSWFTCGSIWEVATIDYPEPGRVHVMCSNELVAGVRTFAFKADDSATASRMLSLFNTAYVTGTPLELYYVTDDASSWGCPPTACRMLEGARLFAP